MPRHRLRAALLLPALALMLLLDPVASSAQTPTRDVKLSGMGTRKCSDWQHWKESRNTESRAMVLEWTQGFIAGHNVYARAGSAGASSVVANVNVLIPLLDSYCQKNPDERILSGVLEITKGLGGVKVDLAPKVPPVPNPQPETKGKLES